MHSIRPTTVVHTRSFRRRSGRRTDAPAAAPADRRRVRPPPTGAPRRRLPLPSHTCSAAARGPLGGSSCCCSSSGETNLHYHFQSETLKRMFPECISRILPEKWSHEMLFNWWQGWLQCRVQTCRLAVRSGQRASLARSLARVARTETRACSFGPSLDPKANGRTCVRGGESGVRLLDQSERRRRG